MNSKNLKTLVLNNQYLPLSLFPLSTTTAEDAIHNHLSGSCSIVVPYEYKVLTPSRDDLYWPSIVANHNSHSYKKELQLRKDMLYYRDHCVCMYCGIPLTISNMTFDHVVPRSVGGSHTWDNVVACCKDCNNEKSDAINPSKWKPKQKPWTPTYYQMLEIRKRYPITIEHESWLDFIPRWTGPVLINRPSSTKLDKES